MVETCDTTADSVQLLPKLKHQLEFYFSDSNLFRDRFLQSQLAKSEFVDLSVLATFARVKAMTEDLHLLSVALHDSDILELNQEKTAVKRRIPFDKDAASDRSDMTVMVCGLPETEDWDTVLQYFQSLATDESVAVKVALVKRKMNADKFTGVVYVELTSKEDAEKLIALKNLKYSDDVQLDVKAMGKSHKQSKQEEKQRQLAETREKARKSACKFALVDYEKPVVVKEEKENNGENAAVVAAPEEEETGKKVNIVMDIKNALVERCGKVFITLDGEEQKSGTARFNEKEAAECIELVNGADKEPFVVQDKFKIQLSALDDAEFETFFEKNKEHLLGNGAQKRKFGGGRGRGGNRFKRSRN